MSHAPVTRRMPLLGIAVLLSVGSGVGVLPAVATASPGITAVVAPAAAPLTGKEYVALGDSFTADWGVDPVAADEPSTGCRQSTNNYPHQVAANLGLNLTDVSCAGALTTNMTQSQTSFPDGLTHPAAPPQFDALTATTEIVTIGIGGNDFGFVRQGSPGRSPVIRHRRSLGQRGHHGADPRRRPHGPAASAAHPDRPADRVAPRLAAPASSDVAVGSLHPNLEGAIQQSESVTFTILQTLTGISVDTPSPTTVTTTATVTETVTSTATVTATSGSSSSAAAPTSSSSAVGSTGQTDRRPQPPERASRRPARRRGRS